MAEIVYFYDRRYWSAMQLQWADGLVAVCPDAVDPFEWRESARRLAKCLGCHIRTGLRTIVVGGGRRAAIVAEANDGFPLGITDPYERDAWLRAQCRDCDEASDA